MFLVIGDINMECNYIYDVFEIFLTYVILLDAHEINL